MSSELKATLDHPTLSNVGSLVGNCSVPTAPQDSNSAPSSPTFLPALPKSQLWTVRGLSTTPPPALHGQSRCPATSQFPRSFPEALCSQHEGELGWDTTPLGCQPAPSSGCAHPLTSRLIPSPYCLIQRHTQPIAKPIAKPMPRPGAERAFSKGSMLTTFPNTLQGDGQPLAHKEKVQKPSRESAQAASTAWAEQHRVF